MILNYNQSWKCAWEEGEILQSCLQCARWKQFMNVGEGSQSKE